jgi:5'-3' exonuclease
MIIVDYNGIAISSVVVQKLAIEENLIRHFILNTLRMYNKKFRKDYGQMVIACDSSTWRRQYFPNYKFKRRESRDKDEVEKANWEEIFRIIGMVREEIQENLPYRVVKVDGAEADDIIGTLAMETQEFGKHDDVMIVSADKDFVQLQKYKNVKQYSPMQKKFVTEKNPNTYLFEHVLKGDSGDGVPNVLSGDNVFAEGVRQTPVTRKKLDYWTEHAQDLQSVMESEIYRNYMRNKKLIDLEEIPEELRTEIINTYESQEDTPKNRVMKYLISKRCKNLITDIEDFF